MTRRRSLAVVLVLVLGLLFVLPTRTPAPAPTFEDLHASATSSLPRTGPLDPATLAALDRACASLSDPRASDLYALGIDHLRADRRDLAEPAFACALRAERESWVDR